MDAADWDRRYQKTGLGWDAPPNTVVSDLCWALAPGRAVDLGCGEGRNAIWLAERGWSVTAIDFSQVAIDKARTVVSRKSRAVRNRITWRCEDATTADLDGPVDLIVIAFVHLPRAQLHALLDRATDALAPAGALCIVGHDIRNLTEGYGGPDDPDVHYDPDQLAAALTGHLEVRVAQRRKRLTEDRDAIDAVVFAVRPGAGGDPT
nr:class I SAM-dependent methyltransferase [Aldersonia kunmingensis]